MGRYHRHRCVSSGRRGSVGSTGRQNCALRNPARGDGAGRRCVAAWCVWRGRHRANRHPHHLCKNLRRGAFGHQHGRRRGRSTYRNHLCPVGGCRGRICRRGNPSRAQRKRKPCHRGRCGAKSCGCHRPCRVVRARLNRGDCDGGRCGRRCRRSTNCGGGSSGKQGAHIKRGRAMAGVGCGEQCVCGHRGVCAW